MPNSNTLNLLSDSTFGGKLDEQNAILEDIRDNLGGNLAGTIATIETSPAAAAHAVGEYIYYNTKLYKVTAAIALGDTLTVGTNIAETKVMDEIPSVTNSIASGNTDVPTSDAVYNAIQSAGSGFEFIIPKSYDQASITDDLFISPDDYTQTNPRIENEYILYGKYIRSKINNLWFWFKMESYGLNTIDDFYNHIIINLSSFTGNNSNLPFLDFINSPPFIATHLSGYIALKIHGTCNTNIMYVK